MSDLQLHTGDSADAEIIATLLEPPRGGRSWVDHAAAADAWERQHAAEWVRVDQKLRGIAARRAALDAEEASLLRHAEELKLWRGWGFGSMLEYMERAMGYAPHTAAERLRVARAIAELPLIAEALEQGALAHSAVRELSRVAVPDTEADWLDAARGKSLREIEAMVSGHKPGDLPNDETEPRLHRKKLTLEVSPETYDIWRKLHALAAEEHGQRLSDDELIQSLFRRAYGDGAVGGGDVSAGVATGGSTGGGTGGSIGASASASAHGTGAQGASASAIGASSSAIGASSSAIGTGSPAYKIAIKQCPDCKRAWQYSGGRDIEIDPAVAECAACDAVHLGSLDASAPERATTTVTPRKREQVLARDGHCCTVPGCRRNVGLDLHHIEYQSRGGGHELSNLTTICDLHHRAVHYEKLVIRGSAPDRITFELRTPRDRRNVTDDDSPTPLSPRAASGASPSFARTASAPESGRSPAVDVESDPRRAADPLAPAGPAWDPAAPSSLASAPAGDVECDPRRADGPLVAAGPGCARFASRDESRLPTCGHLDGHGGVEPSECRHRSGLARDS